MGRVAGIVPRCMLLLVLLSSGCAISRVYVSPRDIRAGATHHQRTVGFFWNLVPASPVDVAGSCATGVQRVAVRRGVFSGVISLLTAGIVIPTDVQITCNGS